MERLAESGDFEYARTEAARMKKLLGKGSTLSDDKKREFGVRVNVLSSFTLPA